MAAEIDLKVLLVSAEVAPFAKAGGLADVAGALPKALNALGVDIRIAMPSYRMVRDNRKYSVSDPIDVFAMEERPGLERIVEIRETRIPAFAGVHGDIPVYLVGERREGTYDGAYFDHAVNSGTIYAMEPDPYIFFDKAIVAWLARLDEQWKPNIVHSNDWHCGLIPLFARQLSVECPRISDITHVFTIHNLAYQGDFGKDQWYVTGLDDDLYTMEGLESYGRWSFMKGALNFADYITTVSPTYAREILSPEYGNGLDGLLHKLDTQGRLTGILNGIDTHVFNPETDPWIPHHYSVRDAAGKAICKASLQQELGLDEDPSAIVVGMVSRFVEQKGLDLFHGEAESILKGRIQFAMLGMGDPRFEKFLVGLSGQYPGKAAVRIEFNAALAQRIYAGSDLFLMPSRFEPCGLGQLIALRYGSLPIVRSTGGLADTITDYSTWPECGNGFAFSAYTGDALDEAICRAAATVSDGNKRDTLVARALAQDWSWDRSAINYLALYDRAVATSSFAQDCV